MPITIGSNIASLQGQRNLGQVSKRLSNVYERLASGLRINRASDDAAGLAISESLNKDARVYNQGIRNLNDGISVLNVADGAIAELSRIVIRLEELATQAANGTFGVAQRKTLDEEAQTLAEEYFRVARSAEFNDLNLLDGNLGTLRLQAGFGTDGAVASGIGGAIGTGEFQRVNQFGVGANLNDITTGDFNNDGIIDLAAAPATENVAIVMLGQGDGTFGPSTSYATGGSGGPGIYSVATGDFNGDGILDLTAADIGDSQVAVLLGRGDGSFSTEPSLAHTAGEIMDVTTGDFNGDGITDIASIAYLNDEIAVFIGRGDGTFETETNYTTGSRPSSIRCGDFNGDGIDDLVTADKNGGSVSISIGSGSGSFSASISYAIVDGSPWSVAIADFNKDGILDLTTNNDGGTVSIMLGQGDGTFSGATTYTMGGGTAQVPGAITVADFNGDGNPDIAASNRTQDKVDIRLGRGDGTFGALSSLSAPELVTGVTTGDFNCDGVPDIVTVSALSAVRILQAETQDGVAPLLPFSLKTIADARQALPVLSRQREQLAVQRGEIGGFYKRLGVAMNTMQVAKDNFSAARSRIVDADVADESSKMVRNQILQQAAAAVLSQANQQPALAIQLLQT